MLYKNKLREENSYEELIKNILLNENKHNLYDIKFKNKYPIWPYYRMYFFFGLLKTKNFANNQITSNNFNIPTLKKLIKLIIHSKFLYCILPQRKRYIIISSQRYINGEEIYTKDIKIILKDDFLEFSLSNRFEFQPGPIYLDSIKIIIRIIAKFVYKLSFSTSPIRYFIDEIGAPIKFNDEFKKNKVEYILWYWFYRFIFRIQKPNMVFFVSGVYFTPMIAAAKSLNIKVFEIQHGVINNFHLAYHFPGINGKFFFSDGILLLSNYWKSKAEYPIGTKLYNIGNNFYNAEQQLIKKNLKLVVILGDHTLAQKIIKFVSINISFFISNGFEINYKLHPFEISDWEDRYVELKLMQEKRLLKVVTNEPPLSKLLDECEIVFGVNSTAVYESLDRGCKAFILDMPTSEYFDDLKERGIIKKVNPDIELTLNDLEFNPKDREKFFAPTDFEAIKRIVN